MTDTFEQMLSALRSLGTINNQTPTNKNGKPSKFLGTLNSKIGNREVSLGLLHYPWNRTIGVNKIQQALQFAMNTDLDGAVIVGTKFTTSAVEQAYRANNVTDKRILLMDSDEISAVLEANSDF
ncbi:MAG: hypothetical protein IH840_02630 [Candidatus Heimdallarchaeota archaeon]|nr:hypothetical protein [Candidatus Heimdallarchaeota archaeon]